MNTNSNYHVTFPILLTQYGSFCSRLKEKGFIRESNVSVGDAFFDTGHLTLQTFKDAGWWLRYREIDGEKTSWILRKCKNLSSEEGDYFVSLVDIKDENQILNEVWGVIKPGTAVPTFSGTDELLDLMVKELSVTIVSNFTRTQFHHPKNHVNINVDVVQLTSTKYSITGTLSTPEYSQLIKAKNDYLSELGTHHVRSKVVECLHSTRQPLYEELKSKQVVPDIEYYSEHITKTLPSGVECNYFS
eukprot:TRINITY_DN10506_c0_g1_i1.p1 TRINITY_DN10506_c0_g1~~TRINITY_DN10506_c0_g1_i1.p1  ORF type:complete len:245 (-),score=26.89 TRINITY_DN10506_c0_g1_i1:264-998(-)